MMSANAPETFVERPHELKGGIWAWTASIFCCLVLLGAVQYCPSYMAGKMPLLQMWLNTFWSDVSTQIAGLFSAKSHETLAGETTASEWNYCLAVPFIVLWLVWRLLPQLKKMPHEGNSLGYAVLAAGFLLYIVGFLMENYYIGMGSMEFVYAGLVILFLGWDAMRLLLFPILFLMFMWPYNFMEDVALDLREVMSALSHHVLHLLGVANNLQGTAIVSVPGAARPFAIDIADPCSGIRSLFALVMLAAVYAFLTFDKLWQQAIIVALSVPLVLIGNLVRIMILTFGTMWFGEHFALGTNDAPSWYHEGAGYLVYLINFGGLILAGSYLSRLITKSQKHA